MSRRSETTAQARVALPAEVDLHARPAAMLVRAASGFASTVTIVAGDKQADAKSVLSVLALGARRGTELELRASGPDAAAVIESLTRCVSGLSDSH